jgi:hypothetical protein
MKRLFAIAAMLAATTGATAAQDTETTSRTKVKADDATVVSLTGCLRHDATTGRYSLVGTTAAAGDKVTTKTKVDTDIDDDDVEVTARSRSRADDADHAVGTSGTVSTYLLVPRANVALASHVGRQVQVSAIMLHPGEDDADVKIEDRTTVDPDDAPERTGRSKTKIEVEDVPHGQYAVVSVKDLAASCASR